MKNYGTCRYCYSEDVPVTSVPIRYKASWDKSPETHEDLCVFCLNTCRESSTVNVTVPRNHMINLAIKQVVELVVEELKEHLQK